MEKENTQHPGVYLKHAHLKGYRTIRDLEVDFEPGLNIIIGKNGSGKTNLVEFLNMALSADYLGVSKYETTLNIKTEENKVLSIHALPKEQTINKEVEEFQFIKLVETKLQFRINNIDLKQEYSAYSLHDKLKEFKSLYAFFILNYGLPDNYYFVNNSLSIFINKDLRISFKGKDYNPFKNKKLSLQIFKTLYNKSILKHGHQYFNEGKPDSTNKFNFEKTLNFEYLERQLRKFSPIQSIKLSDRYKICLDKERQEIIIEDLFLEFKINNSWLPFSQLSDGTKRIFYIISEVAGLFSDPESENKQIIFIEEPELGIHPHQLFDLMQFLKEQSEEKQIIITTHSPQVLDILDKDELNRIKITYTTEKGTQVRGLNDHEKQKAEIYMDKTGFLSDYWRFSDLEDLEEE
jgi:predicted ATPase